MTTSKLDQEFVDLLLGATCEKGHGFLEVLTDYDQLVRERADLKRRLEQNLKSINQCVAWFENRQLARKE